MQAVPAPSSADVYPSLQNTSGRPCSDYNGCFRGGYASFTLLESWKLKLPPERPREQSKSNHQLFGPCFPDRPGPIYYYVFCSSNVDSRSQANFPARSLQQNVWHNILLLCKLHCFSTDVLPLPNHKLFCFVSFLRIPRELFLGHATVGRNYVFDRDCWELLGFYDWFVR